MSGRQKGKRKIPHLQSTLNTIALVAALMLTVVFGNLLSVSFDDLAEADARWDPDGDGIYACAVRTSGKPHHNISTKFAQKSIISLYLLGTALLAVMFF